MALAYTSHINARSSAGHGTGTYTTASFTPANNSLLVAIINVMQDSGSSDPSGDLTITDSAGLTWTSRDLVGNASSWSIGQRVWTAPVTTGVSMTVTFDCGARNIYAYFTTIEACTGYGGVGVTATDSATVTNGAESLALPSAPASTSLIFGALMQDASGVAGAAPPASGYTELYDLDNLDGSASQAQVRLAGSTSTAFEWADVGVGAALIKGTALAIEITEASGGTDTPLSVSGTIGSAGAAVRSVAKSAGGTVAPAGTVAKADAKTIVGTTPAAGALANATAKTTAGALTPAGVLVRTASKAMAAVAATAGTLVRVIGKTTARAVAPAGTVAKDTAKPLDGGITPSGAYSAARTVLLSLAGTIAAAGALVRAVGKTTTGAASSAGDSSRAITRTTTGTITPAGSVAKATAQQLASSIVAAGAVAKAVGLSLFSVVATAGTIARTTGKVLAGTLAGVGSLVTDLIAGAPQEPCSITVDVAPAATITVSAAPAATIVATVAPAATLAVAAAPAATIELDIAPAATLALSVWPT